MNPTQVLSNSGTGVQTNGIELVSESLGVLVSGTIGGATATLEVGPGVAGPWVPSGVSFTAIGFNKLLGAQGLFARLNVTGGTGVALNAWFVLNDQ